MTEKKSLVYCHCKYAKVLPEDGKLEVLRGVTASERPFLATADLCGMSARRDPEILRLCQGGPLRVVACYPRAVRWLLASAGCELGPYDLEVRNLREEDAPTALAALLSPLETRTSATPEKKVGRQPASSLPPVRVLIHEEPPLARLSSERRFELVHALLEAGFSVWCGPLTGDFLVEEDGPLLVLGECGDDPEPLSELRSGMLSKVPGYPAGDLAVRDIRALEPAAVAELATALRQELGPAEWPSWWPWFPVIDEDRCTDCMQCLSFCLFDVYGVDDQSHLRVVHPAKCKTNCPACSRVCPEVAIIFPKYKAGPINGAEVKADDSAREGLKADISSLLGGNIYQLLRERQRRAESRFSKERDEDRALQERLRCLREVQGDLDIPPEVLGTLPQYDEIQAKLQETREAAERARRQRTASAAGREEPKTSESSPQDE